MNRSWVERVLLLVAGMVAAGWVVPCLMAQTQAEQAVLAPIYALFDGMAKRDAGAIKTPVLPTATLVLMRDGKPTVMTIDAFAERVAKPGTKEAQPRIEERIHDPLVRIDNDLGVVWAPFDFLVDGKMDHCGTDSFEMVRVDGKWMIAGVADTGRSGCAK